MHCAHTKTTASAAAAALAQLAKVACSAHANTTSTNSWVSACAHVLHDSMLHELHFTPFVRRLRSDTYEPARGSPIVFLLVSIQAQHWLLRTLVTTIPTVDRHGVSSRPARSSDALHLRPAAS